MSKYNINNETIFQLRQLVIEKCNIEQIVENLGCKIEKRPHSLWNILIKTIYKEEKNPSLYISTKNNAFHCFSTNKSGDIIKFYQDYMFYQKNLSYTYEDCCKNILDICGISYDISQIYSSNLTIEDKERIDCFNELIKLSTYILQNTVSGEKARDYLKSRNIDLETASIFSLGYIDEKNIKAIMTSPNYKIYKKYNIIDDTNEYFFKNCLLIPIFDSNGNPVSFSGRYMENSEDKRYLKLKSYEGYRANTNLYNLYLATSSDNFSKTELIVVEGYFDLWRLYQNNIRNVVAIETNTMSNDQIKLLKRTHYDTITFFLDADDSGKQGSITNSIKMKDEFYPNTYIDINIIDDDEYLNSKKDPDNFISNSNVLDVLSHKSDFLILYLNKKIDDYKSSIIDINELLSEVGCLLGRYTEYIERIEDIINNDENKKRDMFTFNSLIQDDYAKCLFLINKFKIEHQYAKQILKEIDEFQKKFNNYLDYMRHINKIVKSNYSEEYYKIDIYEKSSKKKIYGRPILFVTVKKKNKEVLRIELNYLEDILTLFHRYNDDGERNEKEFFYPCIINLQEKNKNELLKEVKNYIIGIKDTEDDE